MIIGPSGSGKTTSLRNLNYKEAFYIDADGKGLSWKGWRKQYCKENKNYYRSDDAEQIYKVMEQIDTKQKHIKYLIIDTLNGIMVGDEMRRVMVFKNKVIIQYLDDFDFVTCYDNDQAKTLYDTLQNDITKLKKKYIVFMGEAVPDAASKWLDKFEEKTGISRKSLMHKSTKG